MKKSLTISVLAAVLAALLTSCIQEVFPTSGILTDEQAASYSPELMINGISADMMAAETGGYGDHIDFGIPAIHLKTDYMLGDIASAGTINYNQFLAFIACLYMGADFSYSGYFWDTYYSWIKEANEIIARIDPADTDATGLTCLAQAYTYRAMCYLDLARLYIPKQNNYVSVYGNIRNLTVPIVTETTTEEEAQHNPRVPRDEMYEFILSDLNKAIQYFGTSTSTDYTRPTLGAAYGLLARAYIEIGTDLQEASDNGYAEAYRNAITYADLAIQTSGKTPLTQAQWTDPVNGFNNGASNNAWIWGLPLTASNTNNLMNHVSHMSTEATWAYGCRVLPAASSAFYMRIGDSDFRKLSWLAPNWTSRDDYQFSGSTEDQENFRSYAQRYTSIKFRPAKGEVSNYTEGVCADHPLMRVEEMYFIKMEATAKLDGNAANAIAQLESFMNTYRYTDGSYTCTATNLTSFYEEMLFQKRVEFWGEGIVMYDHKRLDIGFNRSSSTNFVSTYAFDVTGRSPQWNAVIPRGEMQANTALEGLNNPDPTAFWIN